MAKPICVIYFNPDSIIGGSDRRLSLRDMQESMSNKLKDYHVLCIPDYRNETNPDFGIIELKVFHEKDFTEIKYKELKELIMAALPELTEK